MNLATPKTNSIHSFPNSSSKNIYNVNNFGSIFPHKNTPNAFLYQYYPGKNRFFCNGRCVSGPKSDVKNCACGFGLTLTISAFYAVFIATELWINDFIFLTLLTLFFFILTNIFLILCNCLDPGIIPRRFIFEIQGYIPKEFVSCETEEDENQNKKKYKFCQTCNIYRPPKSSHCRECDNCVEVMDHHCPWINNCVAKRNYKYFVGYIISLTMLATLEGVGFILILYNQLIEQIFDMTQSYYDNVFLTILAIIICVFLLCIGSNLFCLCAFHLMLILSGETTKERLKGKDNDYGPQFKNYSPSLCSCEPSLLDSRYRITEANVLYIRQQININHNIIT